MDVFQISVNNRPTWIWGWSYEVLVSKGYKC